MAQISIFDKTRHFSEKDFTCSIGQREMIYFTFRNNSWKRFTDSDSISVYVKTTKKGSFFRFGDPEKGAPGAVFKLGYKKDKKASREHTRYVQINGKHYPEILEIVRSKSGSYDFAPDSVHVEKAKRQRKPKEVKIERKDSDLIITELNARVSALETMLGQLEERVRTLETKCPRQLEENPKKRLIDFINTL